MKAIKELNPTLLVAFRKMILKDKVELSEAGFRFINDKKLEWHSMWWNIDSINADESMTLINEHGEILKHVRLSYIK